MVVAIMAKPLYINPEIFRNEDLSFHRIIPPFGVVTGC